MEVVLLVERREYLHRMIQWKDEPVIKVVTGIRRCGKSTLLMQYQAWLKANGVSDQQIVSINFEELEYESYRTTTGSTTISKAAYVQEKKRISS